VVVLERVPRQAPARPSPGCSGNFLRTCGLTGVRIAVYPSQPARRAIIHQKARPFW